MRIISVIQAGVPPKFAAQEFFDDLLACSLEQGQLDLECTRFFLSETLKSIGIVADLEADQLDRIETFKWPSIIHVYMFAHNDKTFSYFEMFLEGLFERAADKQVDYDNEVEMSALTIGSTTTTPTTSAASTPKTPTPPGMKTRRSKAAGSKNTPKAMVDNTDSSPSTDDGGSLEASKLSVSSGLAESACDASEGPLSVGISSDLATPPVEWMLELLGMWSRTRNAMCKAVEHRFLLEPIARIDFLIFMHLHKLRLLYRDRWLIMDPMCVVFFNSALEGLFFFRSHEIIANGLMTIIEDDFDFFADNDAETYFMYFSRVLRVRNQKNTFMVTYKHLKTLLEKKAEAFALVKSNAQVATILQKRIIKFTDFLCSPEMQTIYYNWLQKADYGPGKMALLEFLKVLQKNVTCLDVFGQDIIDTILSNTVSDKPQVGSLAAEIYYKIMHYNMVDRFVFNHWMDFFMQHFDKLDQLNNYVLSMWPHFMYMRDVDLYVRMMSNISYKEEVRLVYSRVLLILYRVMMDKPNDYSDYLKKLLKSLPNLIEDMTSVPLRGILLEIFRYTNFATLEATDKETTQAIVQSMEDTTLKMFLHSKRMDITLLVNVFTQLLRCLQYTNHWDRLERCAAKMMQQYRHHEMILQICDDNQEIPSSSVLTEYNSLLKKFALIMKSDYQVFDSLDYVFHTLKARLLDSDRLPPYIISPTLQLDLITIDIIGQCLTKFSKCDASTYGMEFYENLENNIRQVVSFIENSLADVKNLNQLSLTRVQTLYHVYMLLYIFYNESSPICTLHMDTATYHTFVQVMIMLCFQSEKFQNAGSDEGVYHLAMRSVEYQKLLLYSFTVMHSKHGVHLPNNSIWKLLVYYGQPQHKYNDELHSLLLVIAMERFEQYRNILAVTIYNLYKQEPKLKHRVIINIYKRHKRFIEEEGLENPDLLKIHTVLTVLQIIHKSLSLTQPKSKENRLQALSHLRILINGVDLRAYDIVPEIVDELKVFTSYNLNEAESQTLKFFRAYVDKWKVKNRDVPLELNDEENNNVTHDDYIESDDDDDESIAITVSKLCN